MVNRVLWLCALVLPEYSEEFSIKKSMKGGWITGMLHEIEKKGIDISLCFPIYDVNRLRKGSCNGHKYYTFLCESIECYSYKMIIDFEKILDESQPDIVHIWGTECSYTTAMMIACKNKQKKNVVSIQGLVSVISNHYFADIPHQYRVMNTSGNGSIEEEQKSFTNRGKCEIESIKMAQNVIGRTDWDKACVKAINPYIKYYYCDEILRDAFYGFAGKWNYDKCQKYSIFVSQAHYPIKGFHYLLQALPIIIDKYINTQVYVTGRDFFAVEEKNPYEIYLESLIKELDLREKVSFLGRLDENQMIQQYLRANVFVSASAIENSSNSLNEAMIIGVPSVASYVGGTYNRMTFGKDGFLYPHDEPALLAYYVCKVFENEDDLCAKLSEHSAKKMLQFIDPQINVNRTLAIYNKIME